MGASLKSIENSPESFGIAVKTKSISGREVEALLSSAFAENCGTEPSDFLNVNSTSSV